MTDIDVTFLFVRAKTEADLYFCRVYYDADLDAGYTNPGEWPWVALIFNNGKYIGESLT